MHKNTIAFVVVAAIGGFVAGFWLANSINRSAVSSPVAGPSTAANVSQPTQPGNDLTDAELRAKIAEADANPRDFPYQKELGIALYKYAASKPDTALLGESARILERANSLNARDFDVLVALGNAHFDIGFYEKSAARFQTARDAYTKALAIKPGDPDVQTDFGITYFLQEPPAYDKAVTELGKVSAAYPTHERSLQFLVQTYIKQNKLSEAEKTLTKLRGINPGNTMISELSSKISAARGGTVQ